MTEYKLSNEVNYENNNPVFLFIKPELNEVLIGSSHEKFITYLIESGLEIKKSYSVCQIIQKGAVPVFLVVRQLFLNYINKEKERIKKEIEDNFLEKGAFI